MAYLKKIRVIVSLLFFISTSILFLDFIEILPTNIYDVILYLQFIPSAVEFIDLLALTSIGFIIIIILAILFGRVYCSSVCPIGTLQDAVSNIFKKINTGHFYQWSKKLNWFRYSILIVTVLSIPLIGVFLIALLDPFSNFGIILTSLFRPLLIMLNNALALALESTDLYIIYPVDIKEISIAAIIFSVVLLTTLILMSLKKGRLFCNTICPLGTLLGLISRISIFKIKISENECDSCGNCATVCKAECINPDTKEIDFERCVACFNCIRDCPTSAINYYNGNRSTQDFGKVYSRSRRRFLFDLYAIAGALSSLGLTQIQIIPEKESTVAINRLAAVTPPGSKSIDHFTSTCTSCHLCVSVCPTQVLQPSILHYGLKGFLQPRMDYITNYCNYECVRCTEICPTGALENLLPENKKLIQLGKSYFVKDNCIVETEKKECGACSEHCPTKAVRMVPYENNLKIPEIKNEYCIGCGACEYACPTKPYKAIYIEGNPEHLTAEIPPEEVPIEKFDYKEEFPF
ncbi:MAG: 4Fe-4S binding protein [Ignavibacteria bacterium]|nr:4Fe-4S binding protein [Ignavibacteria bacterium]MBT8382216.1 4Fe-4S binding protein [Ignavibacteria bacterium]MBT8390925.1 4Fe-4S binding protein [Ignavibacteria bacterium]NNJ52372.1 4Fe-4S binding protein [Ignavibacteriaceae bacterium]NNL20591.1 4Fe-4S binding protein [Ignavibacteriaceae bacterium]